MQDSILNAAYLQSLWTTSQGKLSKKAASPSAGRLDFTHRISSEKTTSRFSFSVQFSFTVCTLSGSGGSKGCLIAFFFVRTHLAVVVDLRS